MRRMNCHLSISLLIVLSAGFPVSGQTIGGEAMTLVAQLWAAHPETCIEALELYSRDPINNAAPALRTLRSHELLPRNLSVLNLAAKKPDFWESVATAGLEPLLKTNSEAALFKKVETPLLNIFSSERGPDILTRAAASDALSGLVVLLNAVDRTKPTWKDEIDTYRACYLKNQSKLFTMVKGYLK